MSDTHFVLNNSPIPQGEFGDFDPEGNPPGSITLTNKGRVPCRVSIHGSNDGVNWDKIGKVKAGSGKTRVKKLRALPTHMFFHNARAATGPAILSVSSAD